MEEVMNMLQKIQSELSEQKLTIVQSAEHVTQQVTDNINLKLEDKFKLMEEKYNSLEEKLQNQESRLYFLEKEARKRNIVIFGLTETETSYENSEGNIISFIKRYFSIELKCSEIQEIRRIGRKGAKPRPITVTFTTLGTKIRIYKQRRILKNTGYYIDEDFPHHILKKRKELLEQMKIEREKGNYATIRYDKLIIRHYNAVASSNKKRSLSISPGENNPIGTLHSTHLNKKNKPQTKQGLQRASSSSEGVLKPGILNFFPNKNARQSEQTDKNLKL